MCLLLKFINRFWMLPLFRLGLGPFVGNPLTGYIIVLETVGRKTAKTHSFPVNYAIMDGAIYCMAGFWENTDWFRNLQAHPRVELILPSGPVSGKSEPVGDCAAGTRARVLILKNSGFAGFLTGINPFTATDATVREKTLKYPLVRVRPTGAGAGAGDAGGAMWVLSLLLSALTIWLLLR